MEPTKIKWYKKVTIVFVIVPFVMFAALTALLYWFMVGTDSIKKLININAKTTITKINDINLNTQKEENTNG